MIAHTANAHELAVMKGVENLPRMAEIPRCLARIDRDVSQPRAQNDAHLDPDKVAIEHLIAEVKAVFAHEIFGDK